MPAYARRRCPRTACSSTTSGSTTPTTSSMSATRRRRAQRRAWPSHGRSSASRTLRSRAPDALRDAEHRDQAGKADVRVALEADLRCEGPADQQTVAAPDEAGELPAERAELC